MKDYQEIIDDQIDSINRKARQDRKRVRSLSPAFAYSRYSYGTAWIDGICGNFEEYLEKSQDLPPDNELHSYYLHWHHDQNDSVVIEHRVKIGSGKRWHDWVDYAFIVLEPERTLELLTEGKCRVVTKTTEPEEPTTYTTLECSDR